MDKVTVGRIVHYVAAGEGTPVCRAAIVTVAYGDTSVAGLCVFSGTGFECWPHVPFHAVPAPGTWHWPERA